MSADTEPGALDSSRHSRRPLFENKFNVGQVGQIVALVVSLGSVVLYQRAETEQIRRDAAVQAVRLETIQKEAVESKASQLRDTAKAEASLNQNLTEIKADVKSVSSAVQTLTLQMQLSQQQVKRP